MASATVQTSDTGSSSGQSNMLSSKVSRALEVRSDTPAMKAALDALAHLPSHQDDLFTVDSRSVRVAIEQDALQQALLLQDELKTLLKTVTQLRQGVSETTAIAHRIDQVIHSNVITTSSSTAISHDKNPASDVSNDLGDNNTLGAGMSGMDTTSDSSLGQEQRLALVLSDCFARRNVARKRVEAVDEFLERFDLSEEDSRLLDHYAFEDVETSNVNGVAFLNALERVRVIRKELGRTFGSLDILHHQKQSHRLSDLSTYSSSSAASASEENRLGASSALRMMESLAQKQERAYERLYHWLQKYLHLHSHEQQNPVSAQYDEDRLDEILSHPFVRRSLKALRNVPAFYSHLLELIAQNRRSEETKRFLLALTSGHNGLPPIEMRAHDSVVYVGDMLAFCFRAFSVEAHVARGLFDFREEIEEGTEDYGTDQEEKDDDDIPLAEEDSDYLAEKPLTVTEILALSMGGISRPLKSRILQVISILARRSDDEDGESDDGMDDFEEEGASSRAHLTQLYEICGLLLFYASALDKSIAKLSSSTNAKEKETLEAKDNPLIDVVLECLGEATNAYEASLRVYGAMLEQLHLLTGDSEASLAHAMIVRIVDVKKESPGFAEDVECPTSYRNILSLDWSCNVLVEASLPACKTLDDTVTLKQSISVARRGDLTADVVASLEEKLFEKERALIDVLVEKETTDVLDLCGLGTLVTAMNRFKSVHVEGMTMASFPGLTQEEAESAMKEFYSSLYSPPIPSFENTIKDPTLRKLARSKIAMRVCDCYESMYDVMLKPDMGGYDDTSFLGHQPQQVNTLFTV
jgi:hypothetical protein